MANGIPTGQLAAEVGKILDQYRGAVQLCLEEAVDVTARETVSQLHNTSPRRTGAYAKSWTHNKTPWLKGNGYGRVIFAKAPHYRLTHLLEYGHAKVNGGRVPGQPHIAPAEQKAVQDFEHRLREGIEHAAERS